MNTYEVSENTLDDNSVVLRVDDWVTRYDYQNDGVFISIPKSEIPRLVEKLSEFTEMSQWFKSISAAETTYGSRIGEIVGAGIGDVFKAKVYSAKDNWPFHEDAKCGWTEENSGKFNGETFGAFPPLVFTPSSSSLADVWVKTSTLGELMGDGSHDNIAE